MDNIEKLRAEVKDLTETVDRLMAASFVGRIEIETLQQAIEYIGSKAGIKEVEGVPTLDWIFKQKRRSVEKVLIEWEDKSPAQAAYMQGLLDESDKRTGYEPPEED